MSTDKQDTRQWFLRTADTTIFGPVATAAFILWAEQGRILNGHEVSTDRRNWLLAEKVPELDIAWYIGDGAGNLRGPFNRVFAETMLKSSKAPAGAHLVAAENADPARVVRPSNETRALSARQADAAATDNRPEPASAAALQRVAELEAELARQKEALAAARQAGREAEALETERDALTLALSEAEKQHAEKLAAMGQQLAAAAQRAAELQNAAAEAAGERTAALRRAEETAAALAAANQALNAARETLAGNSAALAAADSARQEATREADALRKHAAQTAEKLEETHNSLAEMAARLEESRQAYSELLTFSNSREEELQGKIRELTKPLTPVERATEACASDPGGVLASIIGQEAALLENDLGQEREAINRLREISSQRQKTIQDRIHELRRIASGGIEGSGSTRFRALDATRLQAEIDTLRATHSQTMRAAEERATELSNKIRSLENETLRLRSQATETDKLTRTSREQADTIRRREQELEQERKQHELERENFAATQQALLRRIEQLERGLDDKELKLDYAGGRQNGHEQPPQQRRNNLGPWFSLKK